MVIDSSLTSLEIMGIAIRSEVEASQVYDRLARRVKNWALKEKLLFSSHDQKAGSQLYE